MAKRKMKRYAEGDIVEGENPNIDDETRARARKFVEDNMTTEEPASRFVPKMAAPAVKPMAKPAIVTKEELDKSGLSLRDYMNKQQGLTRRGSSASGEKTLPKIPDSMSTTDTGDELGRLARFKKPPLRQETMRERAESYNAKRFAQKAEDAAKEKAARVEPPVRPGLRQETMRERAESYNRKRGIPGYKAGGSVSSASKRADGIAIRGKTRI